MRWWDIGLGRKEIGKGTGKNSAKKLGPRRRSGGFSSSLRLFLNLRADFALKEKNRYRCDVKSAFKTLKPDFGDASQKKG